ncbi:FdhF [Mycobacteroides abscessus]|nr:FdhF [Mycobacteroides abscessus]SIA00059.1 FdhF [Mycobacteroides abscessus subsp. abscessus]
MFAQMHPDVAARAGLSDGDQVQVVSRRGRTAAIVRCDPTMRPDTVFLPFHFPGLASANRLTNAVLDPDSGMPEFKVCAIRLDKPTAAPDSPTHDHTDHTSGHHRLQEISDPVQIPRGCP